MPLKPKILLFILLAILLALLLSGATASEASTTRTIRIFRPPSEADLQVSPQVRYQPGLDAFVVLGREVDEAKTRLIRLDANGLSKFTTYGLGEPYAWTLTYNSSTKTYLAAGSYDSYLLLNKRGRVRSYHFLESQFGQNFLALTPMTGKRRWFGMVEECKYGCVWAGLILGNKGDVRRQFGMSDLPLEDMYVDFRRILQTGFEPESQKILMIWEDGYDSSSLQGPSRAIRGQRLTKKGAHVGKPLEIARHRLDASHPDMIYDPRRQRWLIVYRRATVIKGRFLTGNELSDSFKISDRSGDATAPSIAHTRADDTYLVTWLEKDDETRIYGRWVNANGGLVGRPFAISGPTESARVDRSGYAACNRRSECLVTWIRHEDGAIRGRFVSR